MKNETRQKGISLLEVVFTTALLAVFLTTVGTVLTSTQKGVEEVTTTVTSASDLRRVADRVTDELRFAHPRSVMMSNFDGDTRMTFENVVGWDGKLPVRSSARVLEFADGDLTLEGQVIASGLETVEFAYDGYEITIEITIETQREEILEHTAIVSL